MNDRIAAAQRQRVIVVGGGPVGLLSALGLTRAGIDVILIAPTPSPAGTGAEARTAALFKPSLRLLERLGVWEACEAASEPLRSIRIIDDRGGLLRAPEVLFAAAELGSDRFGNNVPNAALSAAARASLDASEVLMWIKGRTVVTVTPASDDVAVTLDNGQTITASLVVGADGRSSVCRAGAAIGMRSHTYDQVAMTAAFTHQRAHQGISTEFHGPAGPCTTVPLPGNASSLVWVERPGIAARLLDLTDDGFRSALQTRLQGLLGEIGVVTGRGRFALSWMKAETMAARRVMLVGEAAHVMPPIGAQGLNLGLRDVGYMIECVSGALAHGRDLGGSETLAAYDASRMRDMNTRMTAVDALNQSLLTDVTGVHLVRGLGLQLVAASSIVRRALMGTGMTTSGPLPRLMQG